MLNLLKLDLIKILKDKLFLIMGLVAVGTSIVTPILLKVVTLITDEYTFTARGLIFNGFSLTGSGALVIMVFMPIILYKEYGNGVIRNKIIYGKSRIEIYLSLLISTFIIIFSLMLVIAIITFSFTLIFFQYVPNGFVIDIGNDIATLFLSLLYEVLMYIFLTAIIVFFSIGVGSIPLAIVIPIVANTLLTLATSLLATFAEDTYAYDIVNYINVFGLSDSISVGRYPINLFIALFVSPTVYASIFIGSGFLMFNHKDIK